MFKQNGMPQMPSIFARLNKPARTLKLLCLLSCLVLPLPGCLTTSTTGTYGSKPSMAAAFRPITYSSKKDTAETVRQIRVHNATGRKLHLWK